MSPSCCPNGPGSCHVGKMSVEADRMYLHKRFALHGAAVSVKRLPWHALRAPACALSCRTVDEIEACSKLPDAVELQHYESSTARGAIFYMKVVLPRAA